MNIEEIKERMQPKTTCCATVITLPTLEESAWLIAEHDRLTSEAATAYSRGMIMAAEIVSDMVDEFDDLCGGASVATFRARNSAYERAKEALVTIQAAIPSADRETERCEWRYDDNEHAPKWDSSCGEAWSFIEGGPDDNRVKYCHGCGKPISIKEG